MKILGVDPGTVVMGWGVIDSDSGEIALVSYGAIKVPEHSEIGERLSFLYNNWFCHRLPIKKLLLKLFYGILNLHRFFMEMP